MINKHFISFGHSILTKKVRCSLTVRVPMNKSSWMMYPEIEVIA